MGEGREDADRPAEARALLFRSGGERFALDVDQVREVAPPLEVTPVPFVPAAVAGIVNHRGTIFTLVGFARLTGRAEDRPGPVVLLRLPEMAVGIAVEAVEGIGPAPGPPGDGTEEGSRPPAAPFLRPARDTAGRPVQAVDAGRLAAEICRLTESANTGARRGSALREAAGEDRRGR